MNNFDAVILLKDAALVTAAFEGKHNLLFSLISKSVDVNQQDEYGSTALQWAANQGNVEMVELLLFYGADISIEDTDGRTALYLAVDNGHLDVINLLNQASAPKSS